MMNNEAALTEIQEYLRNITFKRSLFGGRDRNDVLSKINETRLMFLGLIENHEDEIAEAKTQLTDLTAECEKLDQEKEKCDAQLLELREAVRKADEQRVKDDLVIAELTRSNTSRAGELERVQGESRRIVYRAQAQARDIIRDAEIEMERKLNERRRELGKLSVELERLIEEKNNYLMELGLIVDMVEEELRQIQEKASVMIDRTDENAAESVSVASEIWLKKQEEGFVLENKELVG